MKKQIFFLSLMLNAIPFAYWPMKGVFNIPAPYHSTNSPIKLLEPPIPADYYKKLGYLFLYSSYGYSIGIEATNQNSQNTKFIDFLLGNNINPFDDLYYLSPHSGNQLTEKRIFYVFKEEPNLSLANSKQMLRCQQVKFLDDYEKLMMLKKNGVNENYPGQRIINIREAIVEVNSNREHQWAPKLDVNVTDLQKEFTTFLGITVRNTKDDKGNNKVEIQKGDKILDFQEQLINHFNTDSNQQDLVQNILDYRNDNGSYDKVINTAHHITKVTQQEIERLKNSKILAVYAVLKTAEGKESIIWGLSEDNTPEKKRFHWITDLEADFSVLINQ